MVISANDASSHLRDPTIPYRPSAQCHRVGVLLLNDLFPEWLGVICPNTKSFMRTGMILTSSWQSDAS